MERLDDYLRRFGFGKETALGLSNEEDGLLVEPGNWSGTSIGSIPIGQGISVTAMQMLYAYNTIANDGVYMPPTLVRGTIDAEGERHDASPGDGDVAAPAFADIGRYALRALGIAPTAAAALAPLDGPKVRAQPATAPTTAPTTTTPTTTTPTTAPTTA